MTAGSTANDGNARIAQLYRYPVKGLSPETLSFADVAAGEAFAFDRAYAIENGPSGFDPGQPRHLPKAKYLMLMKQERLAALKTRFDDETCQLTIVDETGATTVGRLDDSAGRARIEDFFQRLFGDALRGLPRLLDADGFSFSDVPEKCVSIINLATVRALSEKIGQNVDPLRFRANIYVDGVEPWSEFGWVDRRLSAGSVELSVFARTERCAATNVDPTNGCRDLQIPRSLMGHFGHTDCGVYAHIRSPGRLMPGQTVIVLPEKTEAALPF